MIRLVNTLFPKSLVLAAAGAGMFVSTIGDASACDGKRGGIARAIYGSSYNSHYVQRPVQPCYQQPRYQQPQFQQQQLPPHVQQWMPQGQQVQVQGQQTVQGQPMIQQGQPAASQGQQFQQGVAQQGFAQQSVAQQGVAQQGVAQQQVQSSGFATQNTGVAAPIGGTGTAQANVSAIGALGGSAPAPAGVQSQNLAAAPAQANVAAPGGDSAVNGPAVNGSQVNGSAVASGPADSAPTGTSTANNNTAPAPSAEQNAMESALQALMGDAAPAAQPVSAAPAAAPVGEFSATLGNGTTIRLSLRADGSFAWVASKGDKVSSFQGTFNFTGSSLALNRSNDRQKLEGALAMTANGFKLQLGGQNAEGLNFVRA